MRFEISSSATSVNHSINSEPQWHWSTLWSRARQNAQFSPIKLTDKRLKCGRSNGRFVKNRGSGGICLSASQSAPPSPSSTPAGKGILHHSAACFFSSCSSALVCILQGKVQPVAAQGGGNDSSLGRAILGGRGGLRLGAGGGGGRGGALQGAQGLAEPGVLGCLDLVHQDSPLVLQLLPRKRSSKVCDVVCQSHQTSGVYLFCAVLLSLTWQNELAPIW